MRSKNDIVLLSGDIALLSGIVSRLIKGVDILSGSRRWKLANVIFSLKYKLLFRPVPPLPTDYIDKVKSEYDKWSRYDRIPHSKEDLTQQFYQKEREANDTREAGSKLKD